MLLARAFVTNVSARALLAIVAVALSVGYGVVASGAVSGLGQSTAALELAEDEPGWIIQDLTGLGLPETAYPPDAILLFRSAHPLDGYPIATLRPWMQGPNQSYLGPHAPTWTQPEWAGGIVPTPNATWYAPPDVLLLPPERYDENVTDPTARPLRAYVAQSALPPSQPGTAIMPWEGAATFFEAGAAQVGTSLLGVAVASAVVGTVVVAGLVRLEVLARSRELATLSALAGQRTVRRVVVARAAALSLVGTVIGLGFAFAAFEVAAGRLGADALRADPLTVFLVSAVSVIGGTALGATVGLRGGAGSEPTARIHRRFPGPVRFLLVSPRLFPAYFAAILVSGTLLHALVAAGGVPVVLFGEGDEPGILIASDGAGNPLRRSADRFLGEHASVLETVAAALPQTLVPTAIGTQPVFVRGVHEPQWRAWTGARVVEGDIFGAVGEATAGSKLAQRVGLSVGDSVVVPNAYVPGAETLTITGIHRVDGPEADELVVDLDTAARLGSLPPNRVGMVKIRPVDPGATLATVIPEARIEVADVRIDPPQPIANTPAVVELALVNFAATSQSRDLDIRLNGETAAKVTVRLGPYATSMERVRVIVPDDEDVADRLLRIEVNPTRETEYEASALRIQAPIAARPGQPFAVRVTTHDGRPVEALLTEDQTILGATAVDGYANVTIADPSLLVLTAQADDRQGGTTIRVVPSGFGGRPYLVTSTLELGAPIAHNDTHAELPVIARIGNVGGEAFDGEVGIRVDGQNQTAATLTLGSGGQRFVEESVLVAYGERTIGLFAAESTVTVEAPQPGDTGSVPAPPQTGDQTVVATDPRTVESILAERAVAPPPSHADPAVEFIEATFSEFGTMASIVLVATLVHGGLLIVVGTRRELAERAAASELFAALGATPGQRTDRVVRDLLLSAVPAAVGAVAVGVAAWQIAHEAGHPEVFGHTLPTSGLWGIYVRTAIAYVVLGAVTAALSVGRVRSTPKRRAERREFADMVARPGTGAVPVGGSAGHEGVDRGR